MEPLVAILTARTLLIYHWADWEFSLRLCRVNIPSSPWIWSSCQAGLACTQRKPLWEIDTRQRPDRIQHQDFHLTLALLTSLVWRHSSGVFLDFRQQSDWRRQRLRSTLSPSQGRVPEISAFSELIAFYSADMKRSVLLLQVFFY